VGGERQDGLDSSFEGGCLRKMRGQSRKSLRRKRFTVRADADADLIINRAGKGLGATRRKELEKAKRLLSACTQRYTNSGRRKAA
jgi:hypothetical protein